ncbi:hypothetical protein MP213Fo_16170 [Pseudochrobactrum sp. MP213Fo]
MDRRNIRRIDAKRVHGIDQGQHPLDLPPAVNTQQDLAARTNEGHGLVRFATPGRAQDVEPRDDGAVIVGGPTDEGEDAFGSKTDQTATAINDLLKALATEAYPALDLLLLEGQFDQCGERCRPVRLRMFMRSAHGFAGQG